MLSPEQSSRIANLRAKVLAGTVTIDEMKEAVLIWRQGRLAAAQQRPKGGAKKAPVNVTELFDDLDKL